MLQHCLLGYDATSLGKNLPNADVLFFADPLKFCQVGCGASLHSYFQVSRDVQVRPLAGPLKDIQRLVQKPLLCCLDCVLRVVLLEGEPSPQPEVLSTLEQIFIKDLCTFLCSSFPRAWSVSQSLPLEKHPHSMMLLPPPCFTLGMVPSLLQMWCLAFRPKSYILVISPANLVSHFLSLLGAFWLTSRGLSCGFPLATLPYRPDWWSAAVMVVLLEGFEEK